MLDSWTRPSLNFRGIVASIHNRSDIPCPFLSLIVKENVPTRYELPNFFVSNPTQPDRNPSLRRKPTLLFSNLAEVFWNPTLLLFVLQPSVSSKKQKKRDEDESLDSDELGSDNEARRDEDVESDDPEDAETADEKRIRYARQYLSRLKQTASGDSDQEDDAGIESRIRSDTVRSNLSVSNISTILDRFTLSDQIFLHFQPHQSCFFRLCLSRCLHVYSGNQLLLVEEDSDHWQSN